MRLINTDLHVNALGDAQVEIHQERHVLARIHRRGPESESVSDQTPTRSKVVQESAYQRSASSNMDLKKAFCVSPGLLQPFRHAIETRNGDRLQGLAT